MTEDFCQACLTIPSAFTGVKVKEPFVKDRSVLWWVGILILILILMFYIYKRKNRV